MNKVVYLDYNASTPLAPEVADNMNPFLTDFYGNPSAMHWAGQPVKDKLNGARKQVSDLLSCSPEEIIFTSGGSEANNLALKGYFFKHLNRGKHIITSKIEHPAVIEPLRFLERLGAEITMVDVNEYGMVSPGDIEKAIREDTILITVMHSNNEVGTLQPIEEIGEIAREHKITFHTDASQSLGKVPVDVNRLKVDLLTIAGHKLYAPKGIGALFIRKGTELEPLIHGAGHEFGMRAGTENTLLAAGLGKACELAGEHAADGRLADLTNYFWGELKEAFGDQVVLNGHEEKRLPNTLNVSFVNRIGQDILSAIPQLAASTGSACHAGKVELSPVLREMGIPEHIGMGAVRFSLGRNTTKEELDQVIFWLKKVI
ncbi:MULTISPECIES: cysteine desulfurase family protein [unclassified Cytobacillus]|uniref:cysteine desulfurase family protein n=1 Tax=unclassified Cytobacillus TaxID=2675268 RepID=UPI002040E551|nr:cysteine desulfurase family protein [Cytobacillus sp. AMY 15.2]MCM3094207.1 cysteine desulfurase [Cytobacillus sp. AMY 15.2]